MTRHSPGETMLPLLLLTTALAPNSELPPKILCSYTGYWIAGNYLSDLETFDRKYLAPMQAAGFNACQLKIHPYGLGLSDPEAYARLAAVAERLTQREMAFLVYLYPNVRGGRRDPVAHAELPAVVRSDGTVDEIHFALIHWSVWEVLFSNALQLAKASLDLPIASVGLDLETIHNDYASYDPASWRVYAADRGLDPTAVTEPIGRWLEAAGRKDDYDAWYHQQMFALAARYEREMHAINPRLHLAVMPARGGFYAPFEKHLGTATAPAIMDSWVMYDGLGFTQAVLDDQTRLKEANPHNLVVPWFRINNYLPETLAAQVYHAAMATDGYSNWTTGMIDPDGTQNPGYRLPLDHAPAEYWAAYREANEAVRADLAAEKTSADTIARVPAKLLAPPLNAKLITFPNLAPAGEGGGHRALFTLREQRLVRVYQTAGQPLDLTLRHLAGARRPLPLTAYLFAADGTRIREDIVPAGETLELELDAPKTGFYTLAVTGGEGGMAWYRVESDCPFVALDTPAYFFEAGPIEVYLTRTAAAGAAVVTIATGPSQVFLAQLNDGETVECRDKLTLELPAGQTVHKLRIWEPAPLPEGFYTQDLHVTVSGAVAPYLAAGPEMRVVPGE